MKKVLIKDIPILDRPRERFIKYGVNSLSNEELLSIVLKTGVKGHSVKDLSNNILKEIK
jgi:DNA repair protein RadC